MTFIDFAAATAIHRRNPTDRWHTTCGLDLRVHEELTVVNQTTKVDCKQCIAREQEAFS